MQTVVAKLIESPIWHLSLGSLWGEGLTKGAMASASISAWEKVAPQALVLKPNNSVSLYMSPVPFKLLSQCFISKGVSHSLSVHRGIPWNSSCLSLPQLQFPLVLQLEIMGLLFMVLKPGVGRLPRVLGPFIFKVVTSPIKVLLLIFIYNTQAWVNMFLVFLSYPSMWLLFILTSGGSKLWFL